MGAGAPGRASAVGARAKCFPPRLMSIWTRPACSRRSGSISGRGPPDADCRGHAGLAEIVSAPGDAQAARKEHYIAETDASVEAYLVLARLGFSGQPLGRSSHNVARLCSIDSKSKCLPLELWQHI